MMKDCEKEMPFFMSDADGKQLCGCISDETLKKYSLADANRMHFEKPTKAEDAQIEKLMDSCVDRLSQE
ncbi:MAG: hypothetical protein FJ190_11030 [Gammaproteobacteria bacterium]|nr:hypothetical protein [Gammaproteobacteria bacterium]